MKIALVSSSYVPRPRALERHVDRLAHGLAQRGAQVEVLTQGPGRGERGCIADDGVIVRRYPTGVGRLRFAVAPRLWERLRAAADEFDLVDVHVAHPALALAVARAGFCRRVFTPNAPIQRLMGWPYTRATLAVIAGSIQIVCASAVERDQLCERFPPAARRTQVVPAGVDELAIQVAKPFRDAGKTVVTVGHLERSRRIDRVIAAMASLDPEYRLVIVGDGPARHRLYAHAADLRVSERVRFAGPVLDAELYRWLRTARVVVALSEQHLSGLQVIEAVTAGAPVVASDIRIHREVAARLGRGRVTFVPTTGSPLEVADAIAEAERPTVPLTEMAPPNSEHSWDSVVDFMWSLYGRLLSGSEALPVKGYGSSGASESDSGWWDPSHAMTVRD